MVCLTSSAVVTAMGNLRQELICLGFKPTSSESVNMALCCPSKVLFVEDTGHVLGRYRLRIHESAPNGLGRLISNAVHSASALVSEAKKELPDFPEDSVDSSYVQSVKTPAEICRANEKGKKLTDHDIALLSTSARYAFWYARRRLKKRFPAGEPAIAKDAEYAYAYAKDVLRSPFPLGEPAIAKRAEYAYVYAVYVLKSRFKLGEPAIRESEYYWRKYTSKFKLTESSELPDFPEDDSLPLPLDNDGPLPKALEKMGFRSLGYENSAKSYMLDTPRLIIVMERDFSDLLHWSIRHWPPGDVMLTVSKYKHEKQVLDYLKHLFKLYGI